MEVREVSERFPCGEVEETFSDYIVVSWVMWLFFGAVATWAVWHSQRGTVWNHIAIDYIVVGFLCMAHDETATSIGVRV